MTGALLLAALLGAISTAIGPPLHVDEERFFPAFYAVRCVLVAFSFYFGTFCAIFRISESPPLIILVASAAISVTCLVIIGADAASISQLLGESWIALLLGIAFRRVDGELFPRMLVTCMLFLGLSWVLFVITMFLTFDFPRQA